MLKGIFFILNMGIGRIHLGIPPGSTFIIDWRDEVI